MTRSVCALVSGGLDSCVMLASLVRRYRKIYPVFIRQGLFWEAAEVRALRKFLAAANCIRGPQKSFAATIKPLAILDLPVCDLYGDHWSITGRKAPGAATPDEAVYLPGRNLLLLSKVAVFCAQRRISTVAIGSLGHNPFPDATPKFFQRFSRAAGEALNYQFRIVAPLRSLEKEEVIRRGVRMDLPLHLSFSCLSPRRGLHCGRCNKCAERQKAFRKAGRRQNEVFELAANSRTDPQ